MVDLSEEYAEARILKALADAKRYGEAFTKVRTSDLDIWVNSLENALKDLESGLSRIEQSFN